MTTAQIDRRVRRGQWIVGPVQGVLLLAAVADDPLSQLAAATHIPGSLAYRESAAALWGLVEMPSQPIVVLGHRRSFRNVRTVTCSRIDAVPSTRRMGIATVTLETALCSMAPCHSKRRLDALIDDALRRRLTTTNRLLAAIEVARAIQRRGRLVLDRIGEERSTERTVPLSDWSRAFADRLVRSGLQRPEMEWRIETADEGFIAQVDLAYPVRRYAIELDSVAFHLDRQAFETDRRRDIRLAGAGWHVDRFTWDMWERDWAFVERSVRDRLARR